jgi:hypothetical protein
MTKVLPQLSQNKQSLGKDARFRTCHLHGPSRGTGRNVLSPPETRDGAAPLGRSHQRVIRAVLSVPNACRDQARVPTPSGFPPQRGRKDEE